MKTLSHRFRRMALQYLGTNPEILAGQEPSMIRKNRDLLRLLSAALGLPLVHKKQQNYRTFIKALKMAGKCKVEVSIPAIITIKPTADFQSQIDSFYRSWEWKRLRYDFMRDKQRKCQCCGSGAEGGVRIVVDHIKPIRKHWSLRLDRSNLQVLCDDCNMGKGSRDETDFRRENIVQFPGQLKTACNNVRTDDD